MMTEKKEPLMPLNIQFFAKSADDPQGNQNQTPPDDPQGNQNQTPPDDPEDKTPTIEEIMAEAAAERAAKEKNKVALDKALREVKELKDSLRKKMSAQEQEDEAKREQEEQHKAYVKSLEEFKHKTEAKERYLMQEMSVDMAEKAAKAEVENDMDALSAIQRQHTESLIKAKEAEWKRSRSPINAGVDGESSVTKEQFEKMGYQKRVEFKRSNPELYKKYTE